MMFIRIGGLHYGTRLQLMATDGYITVTWTAPRRLYDGYTMLPLSLM